MQKIIGNELFVRYVIVPTQLLGFADGGMSQGFSTLYDLKVVNRDLIIKGQIIA